MFLLLTRFGSMIENKADKSISTMMIHDQAIEKEYEFGYVAEDGDGFSLGENKKRCDFFTCVNHCSLPVCCPSNFLFSLSATSR